jgi:HSP20 family protein
MNLIPWRNKTRTGSRDVSRAWPSGHSAFEIDQLVDGFFRDFLRDSWAGEGSGRIVAGEWGPLIDVSENDKEVVVRSEMPGVSPDDVSISVSGDVLTLEGEKKESSEKKGENWHHVERRFGSFHRSLRLPASVDPEKVTAGYADGVLTITLAKREGAKSRRIPINSKS